MAGELLLLAAQTKLSRLWTPGSSSEHSRRTLRPGELPNVVLLSLTLLCVKQHFHIYGVGCWEGGAEEGSVFNLGLNSLLHCMQVTQCR